VAGSHIWQNDQSDWPATPESRTYALNN